MLKEIEKVPVSWKEAYKLGLSLALNHMVLTLITVFAILCERSLSLFVHFSGISITKVFNQYKEVAASLAKDPLGQSWTIVQFKELASFFPVAALLFVMGAFFLVGILGLIRDLLVKKNFKTTLVLKRGKQYFWPIVRYKLPIYLLLGIILIVLASSVMPNFNAPAVLTVELFIASIIYGIIFFFFRIFLSLGPKMIVTEEIKKVFPLYRRIIKLVHPYWQPVMIFYSLMFALLGITIILPIGLNMLGIPFVPLIIISVVVVSFLTVVIKASSFSLYLQLRSVEESGIFLERESQQKVLSIDKTGELTLNK